jgi:nitroimidazol reductase NimA-like FMN-containing flavoprotein (pyridoxamine 5'-phosphate oxidase superfamily)
MLSTQRAKEIIAKVPYITVATVDENGMPWNAPVFAAYDENYSFYWGTYQGSQKSKNIKANKSVFIVVYDSTVPAGQGEGVYMRATAAELSDQKEIETAHKLLWDRHVVPYWKLEQVQGDAPIRLYKAVPERVWVNGEGRENGHYIDTREEIQL